MPPHAVGRKLAVGFFLLYLHFPARDTDFERERERDFVFDFERVLTVMTV